MTRMFDLRDILQLVIDGLDDGAATEQQLVGERHEPVRHILANSRNEFQATLEEGEKELVRQIALVGEELTKQGLGKARDGLAVIDIPWREVKGQDFAAVIDNEVQFETIEPTHRRFATLG